ncbi:hypothetical protein D3C73_712090 [compost metagenome]
MTGRTAHVATHRQLALVAEHRLELGRLADQTQRRGRDALGQHLQQTAHAKAADLFVIGKRQMHRALQRAGEKHRHGGQHRGQIAFHVCGATTVKLAARLAQAERLDRPGLAVHRHHVGVTGQHDAAGHARADRGQQIGLGPLGVVDQFAIHAQFVQVVAHELDQLQVRIAADRGEPDQSREHGAAAQLTHRRALHTRGPGSD